MSSKLYVFTRADLSWPQRAVQAGHAVAAFAQATPSWEHRALIYFRARNLNELLDFYDGCHNAVAFEEPDLGYEMTAFATLTREVWFDYLSLL